MAENKDFLLGMLEAMQTIRIFEQTVAQLFAQGKVPGFIHVSVGQEAVAVGVCAALRPEDYIYTSHRGHGHCIAKGADLNGMMAEIFGRRTGHCRGRGGSMHIASFRQGVLGANAIVGGGLPLAIGAAFGAKTLGQDRVTVVFFGDGAANQGTFHESLNLAALWQLPVVFLCENNRYAEFTPQKAHTRLEKISARASSYGMPGLTVDGNDVLAVYRAAQEAVARARGGEGPTLLECLTYRWHGHHEGDPQVYRTKEEVEEWKKQDPILHCVAYLEAQGYLSPDELTRREAAVQQRIAEAVRFAEESPFPTPEEALEGVLA